MKKNQKKAIIIIIAIIILILTSFTDGKDLLTYLNPTKEETYNIQEVPKYNGKSYVTINNNKPTFKEEEKTQKSFEKYSNLDHLNRCQTAYANVSQKTMPTEKRGRIGMIKPSGWHTIKYDIVDGKYLELIGHYNPITDPAEIKINEEVALKWLRNGAITTDTARDLLSKAGIMKKFHEEKQGK